MEMKIEQIGKICHEANRALRATLNEPDNGPWEELSEARRNGVTDGVKYFYNLWQRGVRQGPIVSELLHANWVCSMVAQGETNHTNLVPYSQLSDEQRSKDFLFCGICATFIGAMSGEPK